MLVERGQEPLKGYWSLPGGILETGETLMQGIRREVLEETGLDVEPLSIFEVFERIMPDGEGKTEYHYVLIDYLCRPVGGSLQAASDVSRVMWVSQPELARISSYRGDSRGGGTGVCKTSALTYSNSNLCANF